VRRGGRQESIRDIRRIRGVCKNSQAFRVRDPKNLTQYISERPEMSFQRGEIRNRATDMGQRDLIAKRVFVAATLVALSMAGIGCRQAAMAKQEELPKESYVRQAEQPFSSSDYVFKLNQMISFYDVPGEFGHAMEGAQYGFESLSFII